jgi:hypothetical protein
VNVSIVAGVTSGGRLSTSLTIAAYILATPLALPTPPTDAWPRDRTLRELAKSTIGVAGSR